MIYADYFDKFKCKCGDCRHVCCGGWGITVSDEEYFRLLGLECPPELRYILDCALAPVDDPRPERYAMMKPSYEGKCRLLGKDGLCSLQVACGEGVLPAVCRTYPRAVHEGRAACSASCEKTVELLMRSEPLSFSSPLPEPLNSYIKALQNRNIPLTARLEGLVRGNYPREYSYSFYGLISMYSSILSESFPHFKETFVDGFDAYKEDNDFYYDMEAFDKAFPDASLWLENLLVNRMFITGFPGDDLQTALCGLCCEYALIRAATVRCKTEEQFADTVSELYRFISHTNFDKNSVAAISRAGAYSEDGICSLVRY